MRFMHVAVFHATQVSSCVVFREAFSAAMHRAPLRRAAQDRMSSLVDARGGRAEVWGGNSAALPVAWEASSVATHGRRQHAPEKEGHNGSGGARLRLQCLRGRRDCAHHHALHALRPDEGLHVPGEAEGHRLVPTLQLKA
jgi:hypothetical protein